MDSDQIIELRVELPSGNQAEARLTVRNGRVAAAAHFENTPSAEDLQMFNATVKAVCREQLNINLFMESADSFSGPEEREKAVEQFLSKPVGNPEEELHKRMLRGISNS